MERRKGVTAWVKGWRRYLWGALPAVWFWMILAVGVALTKGNHGSAQMAVNFLFYTTVGLLLLGWVTRGAAETTWTDCMIVWTWSAGLYLLVVPAVAIFVAVQTVGVTSLVWMGGETEELGMTVMGMAVLISAYAYYKVGRRWMAFVVWWGETIRFERSLAYVRYCVRSWKRSTS